MQLLTGNKSKYVTQLLTTTLLIIGFSCGQKEMLNLKNYKVSNVWMYENYQISFEYDTLLGNKILSSLEKGKKMSNPVKGIGIKIELIAGTDTIIIMTYKKSNYFMFNHEYYKSDEQILPDKIIERIEMKVQENILRLSSPGADIRKSTEK